MLLDISEKDHLNIKIIFSPFLLNQKNNKIIKLQEITSAVVNVLIKIKSSL